MGFEWIAGDFEPGLYRRNSVVHDVSYGNLAQPHANHFAETYRRVGNACANPETEEVEEDDAENECEYRDDRDRDQVKRFHNRKLIGTRKMRKVYLSLRIREIREMKYLSCGNRR